MRQIGVDKRQTPLSNSPYVKTALVPGGELQRYRGIVDCFVRVRAEQGIATMSVSANKLKKILSLVEETLLIQNALFLFCVGDPLGRRRAASIGCVGAKLFPKKGGLPWPYVLAVRIFLWCGS